MRPALTAALLAIVSTPALSQSIEQKRELYALMEAAPEYCPNIEVRWFAKGLLDYDMAADGSANFQAAYKDWFSKFKLAGSRSTVCEALMDKFGPGSDLHLFQFK